MFVREGGEGPAGMLTASQRFGEGLARRFRKSLVELRRVGIVGKADPSCEDPDHTSFLLNLSLLSRPGMLPEMLHDGPRSSYAASHAFQAASQDLLSI